MWPLFKEAKEAGKRAFWRASKIFIKFATLLCLRARGPERPIHGGGVNKLEMGVQILELF